MSDEHFLPSDSPNVIRMVRKARRVNSSRDRIDRRSGHAAPSDCPLDLQLRTVISALVSGLEGDDWDCVAEGIAMLQDTECSLRGD